MQDLTFYLANTPPLPVPHLDVNIIHVLQAADLPSLLILCPVPRAPENSMVKID